MPCCYRYSFFFSFFFSFLFWYLVCLGSSMHLFPLDCLHFTCQACFHALRSKEYSPCARFLFLDDTTSSSCLVTHSRPADPQPTHHHRDLISLFRHGGRGRNRLERHKRGETQSVPGLKSKIDEGVPSRRRSFLVISSSPQPFRSWVPWLLYLFFPIPFPLFSTCIFWLLAWLFTHGSKLFDHLT